MAQPVHPGCFKFYYPFFVWELSFYRLKNFCFEIILKGVGVVEHTGAEYAGILGAFPATVSSLRACGQPGVSSNAGDILFPSLRGLPPHQPQ